MQKDVRGITLISMLLFIIAAAVGFIAYLGFSRGLKFESWVAVAVAGFIAMAAVDKLDGPSSDSSDGSWKTDKASIRQKEFAEDLGIEFDKDISKGELSQLIDEELDRRKK